MVRMLALLAITVFVLAVVRGCAPAQGAEASAASAETRRPRFAKLPPQIRLDRVTFRYRDRDYVAVSVAGSFNRWGQVPMHLGDDGVWRARIELDPGEHGYLYIVEERDRTTERLDPSNPVRRRFGSVGWTSLLEVEDWEFPGWHDWNSVYDFDLVDDVDLTYQRVDGLSILAEPALETHQPFLPELRGRFGYGFKSERVSAALTFIQPLSHSGQLDVRGSIYDQTDFTDQTGIGTTENSVTSWFAREDFRDYYRLRGARAGLRLKISGELLLEAQIRADEYRSLQRRASWALGGRDEFRPNPAVDEGTMRSLYTRLRVGSNLNHVAVDYEVSRDGLLGGDYDFAQITGQYRGRTRLGRYQYLDVRVKGGANLSGSLPVQKRYHVGGLGTVRGYRYQSLITPAQSSGLRPFGGERMLLANVEYAFGSRRDFLGILFFDAGMAWEDREASVELDDLETSVGAGIALGEDNLRIDFIRPLQDASADVVIQVRLNRMF